MITVLKQLMNTDDFFGISRDFLGDAMERSDHTNTVTDIEFPHEDHALEYTVEKYSRRFQRLQEYIQTGHRILFLYITRKSRLYNEQVQELQDLVTTYNPESQILVMSGCEENSELNTLSHVTHYYVPYDANQFYSYDYSHFRPEIKAYLTKMDIQYDDTEKVYRIKN
jgi:hypothetical protein